MSSFSSENIAAGVCVCVCVWEREREREREREYIFYAMLNAKLDMLKVAEVA
jgi:hypothetical protein